MTEVFRKEFVFLYGMSLFRNIYDNTTIVVAIMCYKFQPTMIVTPHSGGL